MQTPIAKFPMGCVGCKSEGMREILTPSLTPEHDPHPIVSSACGLGSLPLSAELFPFPGAS